MTTDDNPDTSRTKVETYLPAYQKKIWRSHAEELSMSQSEFVKAMVQAGRRGFESNEIDEFTGNDEQDEPTKSPVQSRSPGVTPRGNDLEDWLLDVLDEEPCSWDELVELLAADIEERLDDALEQLQGENRIQYSGRRGGYIKSEVE